MPLGRGADVPRIERLRMARCIGAMTTTHLLLTPGEAAEYLRCSRRHVENLVRRGLLRARKIGRLTGSDVLSVEVLGSAASCGG